MPGGYMDPQEKLSIGRRDTEAIALMLAEQCLRDRSPAVREMAVGLLLCLGKAKLPHVPARIIEALRSVIGDPDPAVRSQSLASLKLLGHGDGFPAPSRMREIVH